MSGHNSNGKGYTRPNPYHRKQHQSNYNHGNSRHTMRDSADWDRQLPGKSFPQPQAPCKQTNPPNASFSNLPPPSSGYPTAISHKVPNGYYATPGYYPAAPNFHYQAQNLSQQAMTQMHPQFFPVPPLRPLPQPPGQPQQNPPPPPPPMGYYAHAYLAQNCYTQYPPPQQPWLGGYLHAQSYQQLTAANFRPPPANAYLVPPVIPKIPQVAEPDMNHYQPVVHPPPPIKPAVPVTPPQNRFSYSPHLPGSIAHNEKLHISHPKPHVFPIEPTPKDLPSPSPPRHVGPTELYEKIAQIGEGTYGKVYKAKNLQTQTFVALKCLRLEKEREGFPLTALREIKLLQRLRSKWIVQLLEILNIDKSIYMVFEYMDYDLSGFLSHPASILTPCHIRHLMRQLLQGLEFLHNNDIVHRDLKGSNLLLDKKGNLKIADFGLARLLDQKRNSDYTNRVITLWYRPPELLLGATNYGSEVDLWGAGCIMLEMFVRAPVFPGKDELDQLDLIYRCLGTPNSITWPKIEDLPWYQLLLPIERHRPNLRSTYSSVLPELGLDLVELMLSMCPRGRISAQKALDHPYFRRDKPRIMDFPSLEGDWHEYEVKILQRKELAQKSPS